MTATEQKIEVGSRVWFMPRGSWRSRHGVVAKIEGNKARVKFANGTESTVLISRLKQPAKDYQ